MRFEELADELDEISLHYKLDGRDHIARQYQLASSALRTEKFIPPDPARLDDVGTAIRDDIAEWMAYGEIPRLQELREARPYIGTVTEIAKVGPKTAERMNEEKGVESIDDVKKLAENGELEDVSGIGPKTATTIRRSIGQR